MAHSAARRGRVPRSLLGLVAAIALAAAGAFSGTTGTPAHAVTPVTSGIQLLAPSTFGADRVAATTQFVGTRIIVGPQALVVRALSRYFHPGNSQTHQLKIVRASDGATVASASLDLATGSPDAYGFKTAPLASPVVLGANTEYYLVSQEFAGGDVWKDDVGTVLTPTAAITAPGSVHQSGSGWMTTSTANTGYGPVSLLYGLQEVQHAHTALTAEGADRRGAAQAGLRFTVGPYNITVTDLGRFAASGNFQQHQVRILDASTGALVAAATVDMGVGAADADGFKYATLASPVTLSANGSYYLVSEEFAGGDLWKDNAGTAVSPSMVLTITGSVYWNGTTWVSNGSAGESYGPLTMKFQSLVVGTRPTASYYIDNRPGSNCSDTGAGTSTSAPWCSFEPVNISTGFAAGSSILLARGATLIGPLEIRGSGTSAAWNSLGAYGSGNRPVITGGDVETGRTIFMANPNYWSVSGLEIKDAGMGIAVGYNTVGNHGLRFTDLYIHDLDFYTQGSPRAADGGSYWSTTISIGASGIDPEGASIIDGVEISSVYSVNATAPSLGGATFGLATGTVDHGAVTNATIRNNSFNDANGGMSLQSVSGARVEGNFISSMGQDPKTTGHTSLFLWHTQGIDIFNNVIMRTADTASPDQSAIDLEGFNDDIYIRGNYFGENPGPGVEVLALGGRPGDYNTDITIEENIFRGNGTSGSSTYRGAVLFGINTGAPQSGVIRDNLYHEPTGGLTNALPASWTATGNSAIATTSDLTHNGRDYTASAWAYHQLTGTGYSGLTPSGGNWTGTGGSLVAPTDMVPPSGSGWVTRSWTAPHAGTVTIRSHAALVSSAGDGVRIRITKNGVGIWPGPGLWTTLTPSGLTAAYGAATGVPVAAGDVIRFEVNSGAAGDNVDDWVSWSPGIGYQ